MDETTTIAYRSRAVLSGQAIINQLKSIQASWIEDTDHDQVHATEDVMTGK
jgi:hypothetical protein